MSRIKITEIFYSLQAETKTVGLPTVFVRLTGCPLRCGYCDTAYAFKGGNYLEVDEILQKVKQYNTKYVTVTGGEPLAQKACIELLKTLCDEGYQVSLETSGALDVAKVDARVIKVIDFKTPDSLEEAKNRFENVQHILPHDQVKFVLCSKNDYEWAKSIIEKYDLVNLCEILFSPSFADLEPGLLADWLLKDQLQVRMQIQLHKILWGDAIGR